MRKDNIRCLFTLSLVTYFSTYLFLFVLITHASAKTVSSSTIGADLHPTTINSLIKQAKKFKSESVLSLSHSYIQNSKNLDLPTTPLPSWERYYQSGIECYQKHIFSLSEHHLLAAEKLAKITDPTNKHLVSTYLALADLYLATEFFEKADRLYKKSLPMTQKLWGVDSKETAQALLGLAEYNYAIGNYAYAETLANRALSLRKIHFPPTSLEIGQCLKLLAKLADKFGWTKEAEQLFKQSLDIFEQHSGSHNLNLADLLQDLATFYERHGNNTEADSLFERALILKETAIRFDQSAALRGSISLPWSAGAPNSKEIPDSLYPLRYQTANGIRVATSLVNIGRTYGAKTIAALISLANTTDKYLEIGVGPVLLVVSDPTHKNILPFEPDPIDRIYLERTFWALTWKHPALARLQITRPSVTTLRGESGDLPNDYGGNVFGNYGAWQTGLTSLPNIAAREQMHARGESTIEPGVALVSGIRTLGLIPTAIGPHESRTGIIFFPAEHFKQALLKVVLGNASFEFPFFYVEPW